MESESDKLVGKSKQNISSISDFDISDSSDSDNDSSVKENKTPLSKNLVRRIKNDRNGAIVDSGDLETISVGDIDSFDTKRCRYVEVKSKILPKHYMRIKLDYPLRRHVPKDILVPGNKYHIIDAKIFNLSKTSPAWVTLRLGTVKIHTYDKAYTSYKNFYRKSKRHSNEQRKSRKIKRRKRRRSSSSSLSQ